MDLKYEVTFLSDWHCGSGLTSGADTDADVKKDDNNLPYIAGKTIKGLLKDALYEIGSVQPTLFETNNIKKIFGYEVKKDDKVIKTEEGKAFFSNMELSDNEKNDIGLDLTEYLYRKLASTAIGKSGIAKTKSLRALEVAIPIRLEGVIKDIDEKDKEILEKGFSWLRHLGVNRNRGLGRCKIKALN